MKKITKEQTEKFQNLSEPEKIKRLEKAINLLIDVGNVHIQILTEHHNSNTQKEIGFAYFFPTVKSTWENIKFSLFLGGSEYQHFNFFPARLVCENVFRLEYYITQKKEMQNEICLWEMMRVMKRFFDEFGDESFKLQYERARDDLGEPGKQYPDITTSDAYKDPFPNMFKLIEDTKLPNSKGFYTHYQFLCESHHGKLLSLYIAKREDAQYRRNLLYIFIFCRWLLIITDSHIQRVTKDVIDEAIDTANEIMFGDVN